MSLTKIGSIGINTGIKFAGVTTITTLNSATDTLTIGGPVSIAGTLTYEDVTNVDSVGLITARNGIVVGSGITLSKDGDIFATGVTTTGSLVSSGAISGTTGTFSGAVSGTTGTFTGDLTIPDKIVHTGDTDTAIRFSDTDTITLETSGKERIFIKSDGKIGINTNTPAAPLEVQGDGGVNDAAIYFTRHGGPSNDTVIGQLLFRKGTDSVAIIEAKRESANDDAYLKFQTQPTGGSVTERLRITSTGLVGIGIAAPTSKLYVSGASSADIITARAADSNGNSIINILSEGTTGNSRINFSDTAGIDGQVSYSHNDRALIFATAGTTERLRIDSSGRIGIQGAPTKGILDVRASGGSPTLLTAVFGANEGQSGGSLSDNADKGGRVGLYHYDLDEEPFGLFTYGSSSSANSLNFGGGTSLMNASTSLGFYTAANTTTTNGTKRMTIDSSGNTHFGSSGTLNDSNTVSIIPADGRISFGMDGRTSLVTGESGAYIFSGQGSSGEILAGELVLQTRSNQNRDLHFATGATPTMRGRFRGADGDFFLGNDLGSITNLGTAIRENDSGNTYMEMGHSGTGAGYSYFICRHGGSGTNIGGIAQNSAGNGVTFNTSSDYRLKTNESSITDGITRIKQLKPYQFEWKSDLGTKVDGFFAHEVSSIVPDAVSGEKDAVETTYYDDEKHLPEGKSIGDVKETNRPVYQKIDHSKLVPLLTAALQESITEIESLKARLDALEG